MTTKYHVVIDGQGYLLRPGSYRRSGGGPTEGQRRRWAQGDWRQGMGRRGDGETGRRGEGFAGGYGVNVGSDGWVRLALALEGPVAIGEAGLSAMRAFDGELYGLSGASGNVRAYGAGGWTVAYSAGSGNLVSLGEAFGELMVGASDGKVHSYDPYVGAWGERFTNLAPGRAVTALSGCGWWSTADSQVVPRLAVGQSTAAPGTRGATLSLLSSDGVACWTDSLGDPVVVGLSEYGRRLMILVRGHTPVVGGRLLAFDAASQGRRGSRQEVARFADGTPVAMCVSQGLLWVGLSNGRVLATDGERVAVAVDLAELGFGGAIGGICEYARRLHVAFADGALGSVLACRLPADQSGAAVGLAGAADGWFVAGYSGVGTDVPGAISGYDGALHVAVARAGGGYSQSQSQVARVGSGEVVLGPVGAEEPGASKLWGCVVVSHAALEAGQGVGVYASVVGPSGPWTDLGGSTALGSTGAMLPLAAGTTSRLLWLRVVLSAAEGGTPELRGVAVEFALEGDGKRRWEMDARCEGAPGLALRLLDGSVESLPGVGLSAALWAARSKAAVAFEDVDGAMRTVRVESLEEGLGRLPQERGAQTAAKVRLVEV